MKIDNMPSDMGMKKHHHKYTALLCAFFLLFCLGCSNKNEKLYYIAQTELPETTRQMKSPGFWIARNPFADKVILDQSQINVFNEHIEKELKLRRIVTDLGQTYPGKEILEELQNALSSFKDKKYYLSSGAYADKKFYLNIEKKLCLDNIASSVDLRYGLITGCADQRTLPLKEGLYCKRGDLNFDELQNNSLDIGTPVAILHDSKDGKWSYVLGPSSSGWVENDNIALVDLEKIRAYLAKKDFCVVISQKADIFLDQYLTKYHDYVRMGSRFPVINITDNGVAEMIIPIRLYDGSVLFDKAYVKRGDINLGYLTYTPRNITDQAFKLINTPYGWGGMYGEQDCSQLIQQIFSTVGVFLPRNSSDQAKAGVAIGEFNENSSDEYKLNILSQKAVGAETLVFLNNHVMLFLGMYDDKPYVIHSTWAFREPGKYIEHTRAINRVVVSGMNLGAGSKNGALLKRTISIKMICN